MPNTTPENNALWQQLRGLVAKQSAFQAQLAGVAKGLTSMYPAAKSMAQSLAALAQYGKGIEPVEWEALARRAERVIPFFYVTNIDIEAADETEQQGIVGVTQEGYFLASRLSCAFRPTGGDHVGKFRPVSSGNPVIAGAELQAGSDVADKMDFLLDYSVGSAQRHRMNNPMPGDLFYRIDGDVILPIPDIWMPGSDITFRITPTEAPDSDGIFTVVIWGMQCLDVLEAA